MNGSVAPSTARGVAVIVLFCYAWIPWPTDSRAQTPGVTYDDLAPILESRCVMCHGGSSPAAALKLDSFENVMAGGRNGPIARGGDPSGSELIRRLKGTATPRMPMTGPPFLSDAEIGLFEQWIAAGMPVGGGKASPSSGGPDATGVAATSRKGPGEPVTFEQVAPIFATRCTKCHTDGGLMGAAPEGFRLTTYAETISSFDRVRVVPGNPLASELVRRIRGYARPRMPRDGPPFLSEDELKLIEDWIRDGARDIGGKAAPNPAGARVRLHGTLGSGWLLDGLRLSVDGGTRIDKSPEPGDYVEVRGTVRADGGVDVERLRRR